MNPSSWSEILRKAMLEASLNLATLDIIDLSPYLLAMGVGSVKCCK